MDAGLLIAAVLVAGYWAWSVRRYPFRPCRHCDGYGRDAATDLVSGYRMCRRCGGHGHALRPGARLLAVNELDRFKRQHRPQRGETRMERIRPTRKPRKDRP